MQAERFLQLVRDLAGCTHPNAVIQIHRTPPNRPSEFSKYCPRCGSLQVKGQWMYPSLVSAAKHLVRATRDTDPAPSQPSDMNCPGGALRNGEKCSLCGMTNACGHTVSSHPRAWSPR